MTPEKKEELTQLVECLENDIMQAIYNLDHDQEPPWDLNDRDNWESLLTTVEKMKDELGIETNPSVFVNLDEED